jgi:hypothetical protein
LSTANTAVDVLAASLWFVSAATANSWATLTDTAVSTPTEVSVSINPKPCSSDQRDFSEGIDRNLLDCTVAFDLHHPVGGHGLHGPIDDHSGRPVG